MLNPELASSLISGTDEDVVQRYATLSERAKTQRFGLIEPEYVVLDTETTGFSAENDALIEIAAAVVSGTEIVERFSTFVNPERPIPEIITEITNICDADVQDAPLVREALEELIAFVGQREVIAHNAPFDQEFIQVNARECGLVSQGAEGAGKGSGGSAGKDAGGAADKNSDQNSDNLPPLLSSEPWIDTVQLARIGLPRFRAHNLEMLSAAFCPDTPSTHRAIDDVEALCHIWRVLLVALHDLPLGLPHYISQLFEQTTWGVRDVFKMVALDQAMSNGKTEAKELRFSLGLARDERKRTLKKQDKIDATELDGGILELEPLDCEEIEAAYTGTGLAGAMYSEYEPRVEQVEMACAVAEAYNTSTHSVIEAGTGVGKSMGYLLPLALFAKRNKVICGVATKTNALLDQLVYHELPRLAAALGESGVASGEGAVELGEQAKKAGASGEQALSTGQASAQNEGLQHANLEYIALKGYDHYPCLRKLMRYSAKDHSFENPDPLVLVAQLLTYVSQSSTGDLDPLPLRWQGVPRFEVCASADDCLRNKCHYYGSCLLHGARRQAANADIVVTNHALLFCDHLFEGAILPPISHWVIDEAHSAESEARRQLTVTVEARGLTEVLSQLFGVDGALARLKNRGIKTDGGLLVGGLVDKARFDAQATEALASSFFSSVKDLIELAERSNYDRVDLWINPRVRESAEWDGVLSTGSSLAKRLETLVKECRDAISACAAYDELLEEQSDLAGLVMRLQEAQAALALILDGTNEDYVYYAELDRRENVLSDRLVAAVLDVGSTLATEFFPQQSSLVFTSATLAAGEDFSYFTHGIGLGNVPREMWSATQLASSYDFERNMAVYLPLGMPEPNTSGYAKALEELLFEVHGAMGGSVLTLFTNRREMEALYANLNPRLAELGLSLKCQFRSMSAKRLRDEFVENESLSLFALRSFWEGFDAPGTTLRCVVIPKLPFGRPNDPLQQERNRREQQAWKRYVLPEAVIDLKQAAGRLIRSSTDTGCLVLADARLRTKWYGTSFLTALPSQQQHALEVAQIVEEMRREHQ
ncbi:MAG: DNA polymerase III subunit epsilon [Coriobacteriales bacterium]|nr:DNA polymerase III subunit epsilon [Coriobacteriales bacterium]